MSYISTRNSSQYGLGGESKKFTEILRKGLAPDGGLYVLKMYPRIDSEFLDPLRKKGCAEVAQAVLPLFVDDISRTDLHRIIAKTYTPEIFDVGITPLKWLEPDFALLQLSNGPTLAFEDVALQFLGNLMKFVLEKNGEEINILGSTSGDAGPYADNWACIAAQVVYSFYAYLQATKRSTEEISFAVPPGNFGNVLSVYVAKRMGLPIRKIIVATNENDALNEFFKYGIYHVRKREDVKFTLSNFERFMFDVVDRDPQQIRLLWKQLEEQGQFATDNAKSGELYGICSGSATNSDVLITIRGVFRKWNIVIDPCTAVGMKVGWELRDSHSEPLIVIQTA